MSVSGVIDQSEKLPKAAVQRGATLTIEQDAGTPIGDPVTVTIRDLALNQGSTLDVENGATATVLYDLNPTAASAFKIGTGSTLNIVDHDSQRFSSTFDLSGTNGTLNISATAKISPNNFISDASGTNTIELLGTAATYGKWIQFNTIDAGSLHLYDSNNHFLRALVFTGTHALSDFTVTANATGTGIAEVANNGNLSVDFATHGSAWPTFTVGLHIH